MDTTIQAVLTGAYILIGLAAIPIGISTIKDYILMWKEIMKGEI